MRWAGVLYQRLTGDTTPPIGSDRRLKTLRTPDSRSIACPITGVARSYCGATSHIVRCAALAKERIAAIPSAGSAPPPRFASRHLKDFRGSLWPTRQLPRLYTPLTGGFFAADGIPTSHRRRRSILPYTFAGYYCEPPGPPGPTPSLRANCDNRPGRPPKSQRRKERGVGPGGGGQGSCAERVQQDVCAKEVDHAKFEYAQAARERLPSAYQQCSTTSARRTSPRGAHHAWISGCNCRGARLSREA